MTMWILPILLLASLWSPTRSATTNDNKGHLRSSEKDEHDRSLTRDYSQKCLDALAASGYTLLDTLNYNLWFDDRSVVQYAPAGQYVGPDGIAEYVNFLITPALYLSSVKVDSKDVLVLEAKRRKCTVLLADHVKSTLNGEGIPDVVPPLTNGNIVNFVLGQKIEFGIRRGADRCRILITRMDLYTPRGFSAISRAQADPTMIPSFFCETILFDKCNDIWNANFPNTPSYPTNPLDNPCLGALARLPPFDGDLTVGAIDGNSLGCRILHGSFAITNEFHCPHISFAQIPDAAGQTKCRTSALETVEDYFTADELDYMDEAATDFGLPGTTTGIPGIEVTRP